jgi:hypothetical protein
MLTRDEAIQFLLPKWQVVDRQRNDADHSWLLTLDTGQFVEIDDAGWFHVSGKGWKAINRRLQEAQWPKDAAAQAATIRAALHRLPAAQQRYFDEGLHCLQFARAPRAAIVLGWSGYMDALHRRLAQDLDALQPKYAERYPERSVKRKLKDLADVRDLADWQALALGLDMQLYGKGMHAQLAAMKDERNHCAHIEEYTVTIQMALYFYARLAQHVEELGSDSAAQG